VTPQTQLADELAELDPRFVFTVPSTLVTWVDCETDWAHGPAVAWLLPDGGSQADRVCHSCAEATIGRYIGIRRPVFVVTMAAR
jgi:hypothetical protein